MTVGITMLALPDPHLMYTFAVEQPIDTVTLSVDGQYIAAAGSNPDKSHPQVYIWHVRDRRRLATVQQDCYVMAMTTSPESRHLAVATGTGALGLWDLATGTFIRTLLQSEPSPVRWDRCQEPSIATIDRRDIYSLAFHPQGDVIAVGRRAGVIQLLDVHSGTLVHELRGHPYASIPDAYENVWDVAFSPNGQLLISAGGDGTIHVWDVQAGQLVQVLRPRAGALGGVYEVAFQANGQNLAVFREIAAIELWSVAAEHRLAHATLPKPPGGALAYSPDGKAVAVGGYARDMVQASLFGPDTRIYLYRVAPLDVYETLHGHTGIVSGIAFSHDGRRLVSGSTDGTVRLWQVGH